MWAEVKLVSAKSTQLVDLTVLGYLHLKWLILEVL